MSKLFDAIERIRRQEQDGPERPEGFPAQKRQPRARIAARSPRLILAGVIVGTALLAGLTGYLLYPGGSGMRPGELAPAAGAWLAGIVARTTGDSGAIPKTAGPETQRVADGETAGRGPQPAPQPQPARPAPDAEFPERLSVAELNRRGVTLLADGEYWPAIYFFDLAHQADPAAVEPLINLGAALSELGLFGPANRVLRQAAALAPGHPVLGRNLEILALAGQLDSRFHPMSDRPMSDRGKKR